MASLACDGWVHVQLCCLKFADGSLLRQGQRVVVLGGDKMPDGTYQYTYWVTVESIKTAPCKQLDGVLIPTVTLELTLDDGTEASFTPTISSLSAIPEEVRRQATP